MPPKKSKSEQRREAIQREVGTPPASQPMTAEEKAISIRKARLEKWKVLRIAKLYDELDAENRLHDLQKKKHDERLKELVTAIEETDKATSITPEGERGCSPRPPEYHDLYEEIVGMYKAYSKAAVSARW